MSVKEWYRYLLEQRVTHSYSVPGNLASPLELVKTTAEENSPELNWLSIYQLSRRKGLDMEKKTFLFKLIKTRPGDLVMPDPFGHFWFDFGPYWTNLDIFGPFCLL